MKKRLCLVIDQERCIGCETCTVACKNENNGLSGFIKVRTENARQKDTPEGTFPDLRMRFMPLVCNHCNNPPCADVCPVGAIHKREDGIVILDTDTCDGCQACLDACPYGAILANEKACTAEKCNFCVHRIDEGLEPFCVICCEGQAIYFGDLNDPDDKAGSLASSGRAYRLLPEQGTDPSVFYCSPMEPRGI